MTAITHILYDLGNTLIYFDGHWPEVFERAAGALGNAARNSNLPIDPAALAAGFRRRLEAYYEQRENTLLEQTTDQILVEVLADFGVTGLSTGETRKLLTAFYTVTQAHWQPDPAARSTLLALKKRGYAQGILSNAANDRDVQQLVDRARLRPLLDFVLSSATLGYRKPHPQAFRAALSLWEIPPERVLMVGDTLNADILGAANSGILSAWLLEYAQQAGPGSSTSVTPDFKIDRIADLEALLTKG